jgi:hypothetical protein
MWKIISTKIFLRNDGLPSMRVYWDVNGQLGVTDLIHDNSFPYGKTSLADVLAKVKEVLGDEKVATLESKE